MRAGFWPRPEMENWKRCVYCWEKGANINATNKKGFSPLMVAAFIGHADMVKMLIKKGANVNHKNKFGFTALSQVELNGKKEIVEILKNARGN